MIAAVVPASPTVGEVPTALETAAAASEAASAVYASWSTRRQAVEKRAAEVTAELTDVGSRLTAARRAVLSGPSDPAALAELVAARRALEDERDELAERLAVAKSEELEAHSLHVQALGVLDRARLVEQSAAMIQRAGELDELIDESVGVLFALLDERWQIEQAGGRGFGLPLLPLELRRLSHIRDRHGAYNLFGE